MESAEGAFVPAERHVGLNHVGGEAFLGKGFAAEGAGEKAAFVAKGGEFNLENAWNLFLGKFHAVNQPDSVRIDDQKLRS